MVILIVMIVHVIFTYNARIERTNNMVVPLQSPDNLYVRHSANIGRRGHQKYFFGLLDPFWMLVLTFVAIVSSVTSIPSPTIRSIQLSNVFLPLYLIATYCIRALLFQRPRAFFFLVDGRTQQKQSRRRK